MIYQYLYILQLSAKKTVEKKYAKVLEKQGLDSEEIESLLLETNSDKQSIQSTIELFPKTEENARQIGLRNAAKNHRNEYNSQKYETDITTSDLPRKYAYTESNQSEDFEESISIEVDIKL